MARRLVLAQTRFIVLLSLLGLSFAFFESCDHTLNLRANDKTYINSPSYPNRYPSGSSCRYQIISPIGTHIKIDCNISLDKPSEKCGPEYFYVSTDGNRDLRGSEHLCGHLNIEKVSFLNQLTLAYTSSGVVTAGIFTCLATVIAAPVI